MLRNHGSRRRWTWGLWIVLAVGGLVPRAACAEDPAAEAPEVLRKVNDAFVRDLVRTARRAADKRISGFRHRVYGMVLDVDPDHKSARRILKYKRNRKSGRWEQASDYREPADWNQANLKRAQAGLARVLATYRDAVLAALDAEGLSGGTRDAWIERLIDLMPQDAALREANGGIQHEGRWMLADSVSALKRRAALSALWQTTRKASWDDVVVDQPSVDAGWAGAWKTEWRSVLGSHDATYLRETLLQIVCGTAICESVLGEVEEHVGPRRCILLKSREEARTLLKRRAAWRKELPTVDLVRGFNVDRSTYITYRESAKEALRATVRRVIDAALDGATPGQRRGWITEGMGQRLCWLTTAGHGPHYVNTSGTSAVDLDKVEDQDELPEDDAAWLREAARILKRDGPKRLRAVLTKRLNAMRAADVLVAYALAAFLIEARPDTCVAFMAASSKRHDVNAYVEEVLGAPDVGVLAWHLRRWALEQSDTSDE